jgi:hypothetical protein
MKLMYYFQHQNFTFSLLNVKNLNNREIQALVYFGIGISNVAVQKWILRTS